MAYAGIESEVNTQPSVSYVDNFFMSLPRDERFTKIEVLKVMPANFPSPYADNVQSQPISFCLNKMNAPMCYLLNEIMMSVTLTFENIATHEVPAASEFVSVPNNILHSLFRKVTMKINEYEIPSCELYDYRSYLCTLLTYPDEAKTTWLQAQGWVDDQPRAFDYTTNPGYMIRNQMFREDRVSGAVYDKQGAIFTGRLMHDLMMSDKPLPPQTSVFFTFYRNSDNFTLFKGSSVDTKYRIKLSEFCLFVPIAHLSDSCMNLLGARLAKQPLNYNYRNFTIRRQAIPKTQNYTSEILFPGGENPIRVYFAIIESKRIEGSHFTNPYYFTRRWSWTSSVGQRDIPATKSNTDDELAKLKKAVENVTQLLMQQAAFSQNRPQPVDQGEEDEDQPLKKTRGKRKTRKDQSAASAAADPPAEPQDNVFGRFGSMVGLTSTSQAPQAPQAPSDGDTASEYGSSASSVRMPTPFEDRQNPRPNLGTTNYIYLEKFRLTHQGQDVGTKRFFFFLYQ